MTQSTLPAFGEADLSNCEREQIHLAGSIQPHGALLVLDENGETIIQASANATAFLHCEGEIVGRAVSTLPGTVAGRIRSLLDEPLHHRSVTVRGRIGTPEIAVDAVLHQPPEGVLVVEFEHAGPGLDLRRAMEAASQVVTNASSLRSLCDGVATLVESLTGYDRVMVYRFDELGHGEVFAERRSGEHEAFLGNRYPASDIPQIARRLYLETRIRLLVDVDYRPVPLVPRTCPLSGRDLDMSRCGLRSMSPVHLQYLKNMGVKATLVVSLVVGGELWGLIACHHYGAHDTPFEIRAFLEILAELVATRIAALECLSQSRSELLVRRLEARMVEAIAREGDWRGALFDGSAVLLEALGASGVALSYEGQIRGAGDVPGTRAIREICTWLDAQRSAGAGPVVHSAELGRAKPEFALLIDVAAGLVAAPVSTSAGEWLIWFRPERIRTVTWGGDPTKPVVVGSDPAQLSPRLSFAQWFEVVEGTSDPWTKADQAAARMIGGKVADLALQFRSVRMLIAQDQLDTLTRQVRSSTQPMVVADKAAGIVLVNEAFEALLHPDHPPLQKLDDLPQLFTEPMAVLRRVEDLVRGDAIWRGEATLAGCEENGRPLAVRAEPVFATLENKLGFIVFFDAVGEQKAAEAARRQFGNSMIEARSRRPGRFDPALDKDFRSALAGVVENAQLAALEITYGDEPEAMPQRIQAIRASVDRTADLIEHLMWHASGVDAGG